VVLYVYTIQHSLSTPETVLRYFTAAKKCQGHISRIAEKGSLTERYGVVLEELRLEILKQNPHLSDHVDGPSAILATQGVQIPPNVTFQQLLSPDSQPNTNIVVENTVAPLVDIEQLDGLPSASPEGSIEQMLGWDQFDSLVRISHRRSNGAH